MGESERARGEYARRLGTAICPEIYGFLDEGYIMEIMQPVDRGDSMLLLEMERKLDRHVWWHELSDDVAAKFWGVDWLAHLRRRIECPDPPAHGNPCRTHGDSIVGNAMRRGDGGLIIIDPLPPKLHVANCREADMGRILQSAMGWETMMYGDEPVEWEPPLFWFNDQLRRAALWWCGATARRIKVNEGRLAVLAWCDMVAERCFDEYCV